MKILLLSILLVGCVEVPNEVKVQHTTSLDQCADHGGRYSLDIIKNQLICNDGAEFSLFKGE